MSISKTAIRFKTNFQLWAYAHQIRSANIEIITADQILICDCSDWELEMVSDHCDEIIEGYHFNLPLCHT